MKNFSRTLHEEVFSKKIGVNPPLLLQPEEVPIISEMVDDSKQAREKIPSRAPYKKEAVKGTGGFGSDEEVQPANYLFSNDS